MSTLIKALNVVTFCMMFWYLICLKLCAVFYWMLILSAFITLNDFNQKRIGCPHELDVFFIQFAVIFNDYPQFRIYKMVGIGQIRDFAFALKNENGRLFAKTEAWCTAKMVINGNCPYIYENRPFNLCKPQKQRYPTLCASLSMCVCVVHSSSYLNDSTHITQGI